MDIKENWQSRTAGLIGEEGVRTLAGKTVMLFGVGGVGGYVAEALVRAGIGRLILVDHDVVSDSNRNRQIIAALDTVGQPKVGVFARRAASINPDCTVETLQTFVTPENLSSLIPDPAPDYLIDAIDNVSAKIAIALYAKEHGIPLIASMGTGNKLHPELLRIGDLSKTSVCPLARVMRVELRRRGITHLPVLYSTELPVKTGERVPASISFVPAAGGLLIAARVVNDFLAEKEQIPGNSPEKRG